ncbi:MAG: D-2-hydroxyacid dehydrogenase [Bacillota bacterium]|nr:D-2-hydroxyacid dehydrogenase [Bacillota bacterium]
MYKICILDAVTLGDIDLTGLNKFGQVTIHKTTKPEDVEIRIKDQDIILTNKVVLNEGNLNGADNLKLICVMATGTNNIDLAYASKKNIAVTNVAGYSTESVVQHTFALLFYLLEKLSYYDNYVKNGKYSKSEIFTHLEKPYNEVKGKVWGIIGLGAIGKAVALIARAFGCKVIYYSTSGNNSSSEFERVDLEELLTKSDIVSIHAPLNAVTKNLIDYKRITRMKKNAILLNLGRGGIVNEQDLARALNEERIAGAGLDVLEKEPIDENNELMHIKDSGRLIITPHIAWASVEARERLVGEIILNIEAFLNGEKRNRV